jgi:hypothetical protein
MVNPYYFVYYYKKITMRKLIFPTILFALFSILLVLGCTPKTTATVTPPTTAPTPKPVSPAPEPVKLSPCPKFSDAPSPDDAETNYVLYRDFLRAKDYDKAHAYWRKVYAVAPAADGQRNTVFSDGILFYGTLPRANQQPGLRRLYLPDV